MKPILQDNDLAIILAGIGAKYLMKQAQTASQTNSQVFHSDKFYQAADYLATELQNQLSSPISSDTQADLTNSTQPHVSQLSATNSDFDSLVSLAGWLASNKITYQNQRIAWATSEEHPDDAIPAGEGNVDTYLNKKLLLSYLSYLRDNTAVKNKALQLKLNHIISEVNSNLLTKEDKPLSNKPTAPSATSTTPAAGTPATPGTAKEEPGKGTGTGPGGAGALSTEQLQRVIDTLPLTMEDIDFRRIQAFFNTYGPMSSSTGNDINQGMSMIANLWNDSGGRGPIIVDKQPSFSLYAGPNQVVTWLAPPAGSNYLPFISGLEIILRNVQNVLKDLYYKYGSKVTGDNLTRLKGQINGPTSIWQGNWDVLESWKSRGVTVMNPGK